MPSIEIHQSENIRIVTLVNPPVNAFTFSMVEQLLAEFQAIDKDQDVKCVILTGEGKKSFCAGYDVNDFLGWDLTVAAQKTSVIQKLWDTVYNLRVPVIGCINGYCLGGGLILASVCDIRIAASWATFGLPEINIGTLGGSKHLARLVPQGVARYMMYTGKQITSDLAYRAGLVDIVVEKEEPFATAFAMAKEIVQKMPRAIEFAKFGFNITENMGLREGYAFECGLTAQLQGLQDSKEAQRAWLEKREPRFLGR